MLGRNWIRKVTIVLYHSLVTAVNSARCIAQYIAKTEQQFSKKDETKLFLWSDLYITEMQYFDA